MQISSGLIFEYYLVGTEISVYTIFVNIIKYIIQMTLNNILTIAKQLSA